MKNHLRTLIVSALVIGLLAWFLRHANLASVWTQMRAARVDLLVVGLMLTVVIYWARVVRWRHLLAPIGPTRFRTVMRATIIGFAALTLLPARAGDVLRPYLVAKRDGLSVSSALATIVIERVLDLIAVITLLAVFVWGFADAATLPPRLLRPVEASAAVATAIAVAMLVVMWVLATHPERVGKVVFLSARVLPHGLAQRLADFATMFSGGFAAARATANLLNAGFWSLVVWLSLAAQVWVITRAFDIDMSYPGAFLVQALLVIGVAVPTPGGVGTFHEAYRWGVTTFFHAPNDRAVAAAIVVHAISFFPVAMLGIVFMLQDGLSIQRLNDLAGEAREAGPANDIQSGSVEGSIDANRS